MSPEELATSVNEETRGLLPEHLSIAFTAIGPGWARATMRVSRTHMAANGYLHAGAVTTLADTVCATGCLKHLPDGAQGFTTLELKVNFLGTTQGDQVTCEGHLVHGGRSTQVWDATVIEPVSTRSLAVFRATQLILYPR